MNKLMLWRSLLNSVFSIFFFVVVFATQASIAATLPSTKYTPGGLCTEDDPDFEKFDYEEKVPRCTRNVDKEEKILVASYYGDIPQSDWKKYEFDHLIPLCAGGTNDPKNLWPQPIEEAKDKDVLEMELCRQLRNGEIKQKEAIRQIRVWFSENRTEIYNRYFLLDRSKVVDPDDDDDDDDDDTLGALSE